MHEVIRLNVNIGPALIIRESSFAVDTGQMVGWLGSHDA